MLDLISAQLQALAKHRIVRKLFVYSIARDPDTGAASPAGFWDDVGTIEFLGKTYYGASNVISLEMLSAKSDMTIPAQKIVLSGIETATAALIRGETVGQAPITVSIGLFDPTTRTLIGGLIPRFEGFVDEVEIIKPEAGGYATITLICESTSRALTIERTDTRSQATQTQRDPNDDFYKYTAAQRKPIYFGYKGPKE